MAGIKAKEGSAQKAEPSPKTPKPDPAYFKSGRISVDTLSGKKLKDYARHLGITQRDVDGLTKDRLRQNCKARIAQNMSDD